MQKEGGRSRKGRARGRAPRAEELSSRPSRPDPVPYRPGNWRGRERDEEGAGGELSCLNQRREEESSSKAALRWTGLEDWMERGETRTTLDC